MHVNAYIVLFFIIQQVVDDKIYTCTIIAGCYFWKGYLHVHDDYHGYVLYGNIVIVETENTCTYIQPWLKGIQDQRFVN